MEVIEINLCRGNVSEPSNGVPSLVLEFGPPWRKTEKSSIVGTGPRNPAVQKKKYHEFQGDVCCSSGDLDFVQNEPTVRADWHLPILDKVSFSTPWEYGRRILGTYAQCWRLTISYGVGKPLVWFSHSEPQAIQTSGEETGLDGGLPNCSSSKKMFSNSSWSLDSVHGHEKWKWSCQTLDECKMSVATLSTVTCTICTEQIQNTGWRCTNLVALAWDEKPIEVQQRCFQVERSNEYLSLRLNQAFLQEFTLIFSLFSFVEINHHCKRYFQVLPESLEITNGFNRCRCRVPNSWRTP